LQKLLIKLGNSSNAIGIVMIEVVLARHWTFCNYAIRHEWSRRKIFWGFSGETWE